MGRRVLAGVIGDDHPDVQGYMVIREALRHAACALAVDVETHWLPTTALGGAIDRGLPFLGTCAGFQHAVIEYARSVPGLAHADRAETNPAAAPLVIAPLSYPLVERTAAVVLNPASRTAGIYRRTEVAERYRCRFGLNPEYVAPLHRGGLRVTGVDELGVPTVVECPEHPFFLATLFLPEHASRAGAPHPLVTAYLRAAAEAGGVRS